MRVGRLIGCVPAILAASLPLCWPVLAFAQAGASWSQYMGQLAVVAGFTSNGGQAFYARGSNSWTSGAATMGSTFMTASNGSRTMSVSVRLIQAASASAALAIRVQPYLATAAMAGYLLGIVYNVATGRWEYGGAVPGTTYGYNRPSGAVVASGKASPSAACTAAAAWFNAVGGSCLYNFAAAFSGTNSCVISAGLSTNNPVGCGTWGSETQTPTSAVSNSTGVGVPGAAVDPSTWDAIAAQPLPDVVANALPGTLPLPVALPEVTPTRVRVGQPFSTPTGIKVPVEDTYGAPTPACPWCVIVQPRVVADTDPAVGTTFDPNPKPEPVGGSAPEKDTCGMPNTPPCKIDETGTPTTATDPTIPDAPVARKDDSLPWVWGFTLPSGTCSALHWEARAGWGFTLNPCNNSLIAFLRSAMAWGLGAAAALYCWRSFADLNKG